MMVNREWITLPEHKQRRGRLIFHDFIQCRVEKCFLLRQGHFFNRIRQVEKQVIRIPVEMLNKWYVNIRCSGNTAGTTLRWMKPADWHRPSDNLPCASLPDPAAPGLWCSGEVRIFARGPAGSTSNDHTRASRRSSGPSNQLVMKQRAGVRGQCLRVWIRYRAAVSLQKQKSRVATK